MTAAAVSSVSAAASLTPTTKAADGPVAVELAAGDDVVERVQVGLGHLVARIAGGRAGALDQRDDRREVEEERRRQVVAERVLRGVEAVGAVERLRGLEHVVDRGAAGRRATTLPSSTADLGADRSARDLEGEAACRSA